MSKCGTFNGVLDNITYIKPVTQVQDIHFKIIFRRSLAKWLHYVENFENGVFGFIEFFCS